MASLVTEKDVFLLLFSDGKKYYIEAHDSQPNVYLLYVFHSQYDAEDYAKWINATTESNRVQKVYRVNDLDLIVKAISPIVPEIEARSGILKVVMVDKILKNKKDQLRPVYKDLINFSAKENKN